MSKKIGILIESDFYEKEIFYYEKRFAEEGYEVRWLTRLWGQPSLTFRGHEYQVPFEVHDTFEGIDDDELRSYDAIIVPSAFVSDRLRYTEDLSQLSPATEFLKRAFAEPSVLKGIICHGMWLVSAAPELVRGRPVVAHPNLYGDVVNMGAIYTDQDVVVHKDLVTARTGGHAHLFARKIIEMLNDSEDIHGIEAQGKPVWRVGGPVAAQRTSGGEGNENPSSQLHHLALSCADMAVTEAFYGRHFGFARARAISLGDQEIVFLKAGNYYLELFDAEGESPLSHIENDGPHFPGMRHIGFKVEDVDAKLAEMGDDARITLGPLNFDEFIPGWRTAWVADPDGNIVEISQGYVD